jgi:hypothetical protein
MVRRAVTGYVTGIRRVRNALAIVLESGSWSDDVPLQLSYLYIEQLRFTLLALFA